MQELTGKVLRITFQNQENGYVVARLQADKELHTIIGRIPDIHVGQLLEVKGTIGRHPKFGAQFEVKEYKVIPPQGADGIAGYLGSGLIKGIGPRLAQRIVDALGEQALDIVQNQPEKLAAVSGIGNKKAAKITEAVRSHGELREFMVFLQAHGLAASTSLRIWRHYGPGSLEVLKTEPHRLAQDMHGIGFITADRIARQIGLPAQHPSRIQAGLLYALGQAQEEGNTCLPQNLLLQEATSLLQIDHALLADEVAHLLQQEKIVREDGRPDKPVYLTVTQVMESASARMLAALHNRPGILGAERISNAINWVADTLHLQLSPSQQQALQTLLEAGLGVLTGGPGTGKTTLVMAVITIAKRMGLKVALAAPTGRAAKRLSESCGHEAGTLHRLLEYKEGRFLRNRDNSLDYGLVVVDESSMLDTWMIYSLLSALGSGSRLLLVGDVAQLPSIGPGMVLRQIIESGVARVGLLQEIFRQQEAGLIVANAHRVLHGGLPKSNNEKGGDFFLFSHENPEKALQFTVELIIKHLSANFDIAQDVQVLAPMHRGTLGCANLNRILRQEINPGKDEILRVGDKVIQVRNNYDLEVFNGDIGFVESRRDNEWQVRMGERLISYTLAQLDDLSLAYAITVHKSQGSEYPVVVVLLAQEHHILLNRSLLYTALTRGRQMVVLVGHPYAIQKAIKNQESNMRHTGLDWRISKYL